MGDTIKKEERITSEKAKVFIKMGAFRNMITHVLRFGADTLDSSVEVMGICMGTYDKKSDRIIIENAIPISHGSHVEVGFSPEDYVAFAQIDEQYSEKGLYAVGWYHSHPGWGLFYSDTDIKNHLFYQKDQTPYSIGIVFDHTLMGKDGNLGFEIYRLDDHSRGPASDYHKVAYEIEVPKTLDFFKWVQKFVEDSQKKDPILIKELNEMPELAPTDLQEIPKPEGEEKEESVGDPYPTITPIISGFAEGINTFQSSFMGLLKQQLGEWSTDVMKGTTKGAEHMKTTISQMKEALSYGFSKVKTWFEKNLTEVTEGFKNDISEYIDNRIAAQKELTTQLPKDKEEITNTITTKVKDNINNAIEKLNDPPKKLYEKLEEIGEANSKIENAVNKTSELISELANKSAELSNKIPKSIEETISPFEEDIINKIEKLSEELNIIKETNTKLSDVSSKIQNVIKELRNL
ncbi:MAG: Mov34/MPN/PAD-1 family protein [Promethearchaeota archaeon]